MSMAVTTEDRKCVRCGHYGKFHHAECDTCGARKTVSKGRTGRTLYGYEWICPTFVPPKE